MQKSFISATYFRSGDTEILADVTAEVRRRGEVETEGYLRKREGAVAKKSGYFDRSIAVDPISRSTAADGFAGLGEVFRRDTEAVGIVRNVAVRAVVAALQHPNETVHEVRVWVAQVVLLVVDMRMEIKEINNHALYGIERQV